MPNPVISAPVICIGGTISAGIDEGGVTKTPAQKSRDVFYSCRAPELDGPFDVNIQTTMSWTITGPDAEPVTGSGYVASATPSVAGNGRITFNLVATTDDPTLCNVNSPVTKFVDFKVIKVESLLPPTTDSPLHEVDDGDDDPNTTMYFANVTKDGKVKLTAKSNPEVLESKLPGCWTLTGGEGTNKLERTVKIDQVGKFEVTATAGTSYKKVTICVLKLDLSFAFLPENKEEDHGAFVVWNGNDDNENEVADWSETNVNHERDLRQLTIDAQACPVTGINQYVVLSANSRLKLWKDQNKAHGLESSSGAALPSVPVGTSVYSWKLGEQPSTVYVEGYGKSDESRDSLITLEYMYDGELVPWKDQINTTVFWVDLVVDSENKKGNDAPEPSVALEQIEENSPGKIVFVNKNDDDEDGIPDYADPSVNGEQNLVPLLLKITPSSDWRIDWRQVKVKFLYEGNNDGLPSRDGTDLALGYKDYRGAQQGALRLWNVRSPTDPRPTEKYIVPNREYTAKELGLDSAGLTFYIEGINASDGTDIQVVFEYQSSIAKDMVHITVAEPDLWVNNANNKPNDLKYGTPDIEFLNDEFDEILEDQQGGLKWWWSRDEVGTLTPMGLVDTFPIRFKLPSVLASEIKGLYLDFGPLSGSVTVYPSVSTPEKLYIKQPPEPGTLFEPEWVYNQTKKVPYPIENGLVKLPTDITNTDVEVVVMISGSGERVVRPRLLVELNSAPNKRISVDSFTLTLRDCEKYWSLYSTRYSEATETYSYPWEDGVYKNVNVFPDAMMVHNAVSPHKTHYLIHVHGYWSSQQVAIDGCNELYKKHFWNGYRGNFLALAWWGDEWNIPDPIPGMDVLPALFDTNVYNAFVTAPKLRKFLTSVKDIAEGSQNVSVSAHSLGNLVLYEALRLQRLEGGANPLVQNVFSIAPAVWKDAFEVEEPIVYSTTSVYDVGSSLDNISYSIAQLKRRSWLGWFRQKSGNGDDGAGSELNVNEVVSGKIFHAYNIKDHALAKMVLNDYVLRGGLTSVVPILPIIVNNHYNRSDSSGDGKRTLEPNNLRSMHNTPTLMAKRQFFYTPDELNPPVGATVNPITSSPASNIKGEPGPSNNGWPSTSHDADRKEPFPMVLKWWKAVYATNGLPIGKE